MQLSHTFLTLDRAKAFIELIETEQDVPSRHGVPSSRVREVLDLPYSPSLLASFIRNNPGILPNGKELYSEKGPRPSGYMIIDHKSEEMRLVGRNTIREIGTRSRTVYNGMTASRELLETVVVPSTFERLKAMLRD